MIHAESGEMLTAFKDGSMHLAPKTADLRSLEHKDLNSIVMDRSLGIVEKLLGVFDFLKDLKFEAQQWKLTTVADVTCPELGPELELFQRRHVFSHFRSDTECLDSVQPVMTAFSNSHPEGKRGIIV